MQHRNGSLIKGNHTTVIDLAAKVVDVVSNLGVVTGISLGFIETGKGSTGGSQRVKIVVSSGCLLLTVRQSRSVQDIRVYNGNMQWALEQVARALRDNRIPICFKRD